jgi:hypothetical protein
LGAIPYRPGAGGTQNVENPIEQSVNIISYLCMSNEKPCHLLITLLEKCYSVIWRRKVIGKSNAVIEEKVV